MDRPPSTTRLRRAARTLLLAGVAAGCGAPVESRETASQSQAILGGQADDARDRSTVLLLIHTNGGREGMCSGVVIAPRVVLTAAHCVSPEAVGADAELTVFLGSDIHDPAQAAAAEDRVAVESTAFDAEFSLGPIARGHDVGVAITAAPLSIAPVAFDPAPALEGLEMVRVVGFGAVTQAAQDGGAPKAGRRFEATVPLVDFDSAFLSIGAPEHGPCAGDSGGPVFVTVGDGAERLAGITSYSSETCGVARATNVSAYLPFVREQVAKASNAAPRAEPQLIGGGGCQHASATTPSLDAIAALGLALGLALSSRRSRRSRLR